MFIGEPLLYLQQYSPYTVFLYWNKPIYIHYSCAVQHMLDIYIQTAGLRKLYTIYRHTISYAIYICIPDWLHDSSF